MTLAKQFGERADGAVCIFQTQIVGDKEEERVARCTAEFLSLRRAKASADRRGKVIRVHAVCDNAEALRGDLMETSKMPLNHARDGHDDCALLGMLTPFDFRVLPIPSLAPQTNLSPTRNPQQVVLVPSP